MARPFGELPAVIDRFQKRVDRTMTRTTREAALEADRVAVRETPVDTGLARSNWIASIGTPVSNTINPYAPGRKRGKNERANAAGARRQAAEVINRWRSGDPTIFITNNVNYIETLENGTSNRSANQMAKKAIQAALIKARNVFRRSFRAAGVDRTLR